MDFEKIADNIYKSVEARIQNATAPLISKIADLEKEIASANLRVKAVEDRPQIAGPEGAPGIAGVAGERGEKGADGKDGFGLAGAMIDRDGSLLITMTNGEVKSLGKVVGKDGQDGNDGKDGLSLESFDLEYLPDSHEIALKAVCQGRTKELRYPAGGIRAKGYWREGTKAVAGDAWVNDGSLWIAVKDCQSKPGLNDEGWIIAARKGRDGERGATGKVVSDAPIKLVN